MAWKRVEWKARVQCEEEEDEGGGGAREGDVNRVWGPQIILDTVKLLDKNLMGQAPL